MENSIIQYLKCCRNNLKIVLRSELKNYTYNEMTSVLAEVYLFFMEATLFGVEYNEKMTKYRVG